MKNYQKQLLKVLMDPIGFISRLMIVNKEGKLVRLSLNEEQIKIIEALVSGDDTLILKGRQIGSSTVVSAFLFWKAYVSTEPTTIAILSHKLASSKHLLKIHKCFYDNLAPFLKRPLSVSNTTELRFADSDAGVIAVSAGAEGGLRSFTCSYLHISEYAFAPNPEELKATALSALNNGQLIIETTANYFGDAMHEEISRHERGEAEWRYLFFPWYEHTEYRIPLPADEPVEWADDELALRAKHGLDEEQLYWRRLKKGKMGSNDKFRREYPTCIEDAYSLSGNVYLSQEAFEHISVVSIEPRGSTVLQGVEPDDKYAIGVDVSSGVGRDWSVIYVVSKKTGQPALVWRSNETAPVVLAQRIQDIATKYNRALVLVESNNFGNVVLNEMRHLGYANVWTENGKDWLTTTKSKTEMFENLKSDISNCRIQRLDNIVYAELRAITVSEKGLIELSNTGGAHSDNAVALALAYICIKKIQLRERQHLPNWIKSQKARTTKQKAGAGVSSHRRY